MLFRALKNNLMLISVSSVFSSSDLSTFLSCSNSSYVEITSDFKFNLVSSVSSSLRSNSLSSQLHVSFSSFFVASDSESVIKKMMMIISCNLSFNLTQNQMFLEFEEYIEKKLHLLILNIKINRNNINEMKKNIKDVTINCKKMQKQMTTQETWINDLLCQIARLNKIIEDLWKQIERYDNLWSALIAQTQSALTLLAMHSKDQNVSVAIEMCSSVISSSFLFSLLSCVSLFLFSSDLILSMTSSLSSSLTLIMRFIIEELKNTVSFDMSFLFHSFC